MKATLIKTDGTETIVTSEGKEFTLKELQGYVGGYIEIINLRSGKILVVNEEGLLKGLPQNLGASALTRGNPWIVGDVLWGKSNICK